VISAYLRRQRNWVTIGLTATLLLLVVFFSIESEYFLTTKNFLNIGDSISIRGVIAIGLTIVMIAGGIDLSIAACAAVSGMVAANFIMNNMNGYLAAVLALLVAALLGTINALLVVKVRINPIIATLGTLLLFRGLAFVISDGENIVIGSTEWSTLGRGTVFGVPITLVVFLAIFVIAAVLMRTTVVGNHVYASGGNSEASRNVGVKVDRLRAGTYILTAVLAGVAGLALLSQSGTALPAALNGAELDIVTAVLLGGIALTGGRGTLMGTFLGLLIIGVISNGMILLGMQVYWQMVVRGLILILAVALDSLRRGGGYR
jgi:ribose transport system permease protein